MRFGQLYNLTDSIHGGVRPETFVVTVLADLGHSHIVFHLQLSIPGQLYHLLAI